MSVGDRSTEVESSEPREGLVLPGMEGVFFVEEQRVLVVEVD